MFTQVDICGFLLSHAGLPTVPNERPEQADYPEARPKLVTFLVTHAPAGGSYQTNSKGDMLRGATRQKPNVLSPIRTLRMNRLPRPNSKPRHNFGWREFG